MKSCRSCKYGEEYFGGTIICRVNPPVMDEEGYALWVIVENANTQWCGKWDAPTPTGNIDSAQYEPTAQNDSRDSAELLGI